MLSATPQNPLQVLVARLAAVNHILRIGNVRNGLDGFASVQGDHDLLTMIPFLKNI